MTLSFSMTNPERVPLVCVTALLHEISPGENKNLTALSEASQPLSPLALVAGWPATLQPLGGEQQKRTTGRNRICNSPAPLFQIQPGMDPICADVRAPNERLCTDCTRRAWELSWEYRHAEHASDPPSSHSLRSLVSRRHNAAQEIPQEEQGGVSTLQEQYVSRLPVCSRPARLSTY